jgi:hypothetical protein
VWEGEVVWRLLRAMPKEELRAYRLILERSGLGELMGRECWSEKPLRF